MVVVAAAAAAAAAPVEDLKREVLTSEICTVLSGTSLRFAAVAAGVCSRSGALSDDLAPDFDAVLFVDAGGGIFFFPALVAVDDGVDLDAGIEDRRLK